MRRILIHRGSAGGARSGPGHPAAQMATEVLDEDRSVAAVATDYRCGWHTVHDHVIAVADAALDAEPAPVRVLGIDETRRGKAKWEYDPVLGPELGHFGHLSGAVVR